jgi:hypothetical protein
METVIDFILSVFTSAAQDARPEKLWEIPDGLKKALALGAAIMIPWLIGKALRTFAAKTGDVPQDRPHPEPQDKGDVIVLADDPTHPVKTPDNMPALVSWGGASQPRDAAPTHVAVHDLRLSENTRITPDPIHPRWWGA